MGTGINSDLVNWSDLSLGSDDLPKNILESFFIKLKIDTDRYLGGKIIARYENFTSILSFTITNIKFTPKGESAYTSFYTPFTVKVDLKKGSSYPCKVVDFNEYVYTCDSPNDLRDTIFSILESSKNIKNIVDKFYY